MIILQFMKEIHVSSIPPLGAVRAFEAFARHGSVTRAAGELGLTQSAVSHQLRFLEQFLRLALTERQGRRLKLTAAGREYLEAVKPAFTMLRAATNQLRQGSASREVTVSVLPLFGMGWMIPRLPQFLAGNPRIEIRVLYAQNRNYSSEASSLSVRFGIGQWPGYTAEKLLPGGVVAACSPGFLARHGAVKGAADLAGLPLVHDEDRFHWARWLQSAGISCPAELPGPLFEDGLLTREAALTGLGAALVRPRLIEADVRRGDLVIVSNHVFDDGRDYYLCTRDDDNVPEAALKLRSWLQLEAAQQEVAYAGG